jgi:hypothetical protein
LGVDFAAGRGLGFVVREECRFQPEAS